MITIITILALIFSSIYILGIILNLCNVYELKLHISIYSIDISWKYYIFLGHKYFPVDRFKTLIRFNDEKPFNPF